MLGKTIVVLGFLHYETIVGLRDTKAASGNNNNIVEYENLTGMEAGLLTTTRSSSIWTILISSDETGTSCLKKIKKQLIFRRPKLLIDKKNIFAYLSKNFPDFWSGTKILCMNFPDFNSQIEISFPHAQLFCYWLKIRKIIRQIGKKKIWSLFFVFVPKVRFTPFI